MTEINADELMRFHKDHLLGNIPDISFQTEEQRNSVVEDGDGAESSFQIDDLVNDYYNLSHSSNGPLSKEQEAYLEFKEQHMREFNRQYKPEAVRDVREIDEEIEEKSDYEELDY